MFFLPLKIGIETGRHPWVTYTVIVLSLLIFNLEQDFGEAFVDLLAYYPESLNPFTMISSKLAHLNWPHVIFNLIFFWAFASVLEAVIGGAWRFLALLVWLSIITSVSYSLFCFFKGVFHPTLGLSGVVMGVMGMSAYLMPNARVNSLVSSWGLGAGVFGVPAWILVAGFVGIDVYYLFHVDLGSYRVNLVSHVAGGFAGYLTGFFLLSGYRQRIKEEVDAAVKLSQRHKQHGNDPMLKRSDKTPEEIQQELHLEKLKQDYEKLMTRLFRLVRARKYSDTILLALEQYPVWSKSIEIYEDLFWEMEQWSQDRAWLCVGRLSIRQLFEQQKIQRALKITERCLAFDPEFELDSHELAIPVAVEAAMLHNNALARSLLTNPEKKYGGLLDVERCRTLLDNL